VNPTPTVNVTTLQPFVCAGGSATLIASGADNYIWSPGPTTASVAVSPATPTTYSVVGSYSLTGCNSETMIAVNIFVPVITITPLTTTACAGTGVTLTAAGGTVYSWSPSGPTPFAVNTLTASVPTTYTVSTITHSNGINCPGSATAQVNVNPNPSVTAVCNRTTICKGEKTTITAGGATSYSWSNSTATTITLQVAPTSGTPIYTVQGSDVNGCVNTATMQLLVKTCTGIYETNPDQHNGLNLYPNPNNGEFVIESETDIHLTLVDELGKVVRTFELSEQNGHRVAIRGLGKGIYLMFGEKDGVRVNQKVVVTD
jgi:hypothetical protein